MEYAMGWHGEETLVRATADSSVACSILQRLCRQETRVQANAIQLSCCQSSPAASYPQSWKDEQRMIAVSMAPTPRTRYRCRVSCRPHFDLPSSQSRHNQPWLRSLGRIAKELCKEILERYWRDISVFSEKQINCRNFNTKSARRVHYS